MTDFVQGSWHPDNRPYVYHEGVINSPYPVSLLLLGAKSGNSSVQVIQIGDFDGHLLVAVPASAWNRSVSKRVLPAGSFQRGTLAEVQGSYTTDPDSPADDLALKVWIGYLSGDYAETLEIYEEFNADHYFDFGMPLPADKRLLPMGQALVDVAQEHFAFFSTAETGEMMNGPPEEEGDQTGEFGLDGEPASASEIRMARLEDIVSNLAVEVKTLVSGQPAQKPPLIQPKEKKKPVRGQPKEAAKKGKAQPKVASSSAPSTFHKRDYPSLGPGVVAAALQAGVSHSSLVEMEKMMGKTGKAAKTPDMNVQVLPDPLSEGEKDDMEFLDQEDGGSPTQVPGDAMAASLMKLTSIVEVLAADKLKRASTSKPENALEGVHGSASDSVLQGSGKKAAAARRALRSTFENAPEEISAMIERLMYEDLNSTTLGPGMQAHSMNARSWVEFRSRIGAYKTAAHCSWSIAGVLDDLMAGNIKKARARCGILLLQMDQTAIDRGSWVLNILRIEPRGTTTLCFIGDSCASSSRRRREPLLKVARYSVERSCDVPSQRPGRLPDQEEELGKAAEWARESEGRSRRSRSKEEEQTKGESQEPGGRGPSGTVTSAAGVGDSAGMPGAKLPGDAATTVHIPAFLNSMPRWVLRLKCGFQRFLQSIISKPVRLDGDTSKSCSTWPMPLPYAEVFRSGGHRMASVDSKKLICLQVALLDWLHLSKLDTAPEQLRLGARLTARQWSVVRMLEHLDFDGNTPSFVDAAAMGRSASKVESFEENIGVLARAVASLQSSSSTYGTRASSRTPFDGYDDSPRRSGYDIGEVTIESDLTAKPLVADRLQFPTKPSFDPRPYFDMSTLNLYEKPRDLALPRDEVGKPPKVQVRASPKEKIKLYQKMAASHMLQPLAKGSYDEDFRSGLFSVGKDAERDRMVLDGRPANMLDPGQQKWSRSMASADCLSGIHLEDDQALVCGGEDLKDYFYQFVVNGQRTARNVLQQDVSEADAKLIFGSHFDNKGQPVALGLSTLAMGDKCAVEYAQCSHLSLMLQHGAVKIAEIITMKGAVPRSPLMLGIIVDDLVVLEKILITALDPETHTLSAPSESETRLKAARGAYASAGLANNPKKGFSGQTSANFWGVDVDSYKGLVRSSQKRLWPTMLITLRVCSLGVCTMGLLEVLAGMWVSLLGLRRRLYSLMDIIFDPMRVECPRNQVIRLSDELLSELASLAIMGPLAVVNLRAKFASFVIATDASSDCMAGVRAQIHPKVTQELARHCLKKGIWSKLLPPGRALLRQHGLLSADEEVPDEGYRTNPLWDTMARALRYEEQWRRKIIRAAQHINISELSAFTHEERRVANSTPSTRCPVGLDSQVSLGTVVKGRSASRPLNNVMQKSMCYAIGGDVYSLPMYYNTASNRADGPTRESAPAEPDLPLPPWYDDVCNGHYESFDRWLVENGVPLPETELPFEDLCGCAELKIKTAGHERKVQRQAAKSRAKNECKARDIALQTHTVEEDCQVSSESASNVGKQPGSLSKRARELLESFPNRQYFFRDDPGVFRKPGCLDLYSGKCGVAKQLVKMGAPWVLTFDWNRSSTENLLDRELQMKLVEMLKEGCFLSVGAAPICASFSIAVTPPVRSSKYPRGIPGLRQTMRQKVSEGNAHSDFLRDLIGLSEELCIPYFVENPDSSWWWRQRKWKRWRHSDSGDLFRFCFCRFGTLWKKPTRIATSTKLRGVRMMCKCKKNHVQLRGMHPVRKIPMTQVAQPYPLGLCRLLAAALAQSVGWCKAEKMSVAACARSDSVRIGEAKKSWAEETRPFGTCWSFAHCSTSFWTDTCP